MASSSCSSAPNSAPDSSRASPTAGSSFGSARFRFALVRIPLAPEVGATTTGGGSFAFSKMASKKDLRSASAGSGTL